MSSTRKITLSGLFMALGMILPFFTGQIPEIGNMLLPMQIPVLICGYVCGWQSGAVVGFILPVFRSILLGMPVLFPMAVSMAFELAVYGAMTGWLYKSLPKKQSRIYFSLLGAMLTGRFVWGIVSVLLYGVTGNVFSIKMFLSGAILEAVPGIILQLILVPVLIIMLERAGLMERKRHGR